MAWTNGFHNSVNGDRVYDADQMSAIFDGLITAGVYESVGNKLAVQPNSGMTIQINTGRGWFNSRWVNNDTPYLMVVADSDVLLNRWCAVCVRGDNTDANRSTLPYLKYSDFATTPTKPTMERSEKVKEYCLAYVYIRAGANEIKASDIVDTRQDKELCGWVTGVIEQITPDTLYDQFSALFYEWFRGLEDIIDENVEVMLVDAMPKVADVQLLADNWTYDEISEAYIQQANVAGMTESKIVLSNAPYNIEVIRQGFSFVLVSTKSEEVTQSDTTIQLIHMGR